MSWHCLQEPVEGCSVLSSSVTRSFVPWKKSRIFEKCSSAANSTVCYLCSQSGTISVPLMARIGAAAWILSVQDSHANHFPSPENVKEKTMKGISGQRPSESFAKWDRNSVFWRMSQGFYGLMDISDEYSGTWPRAGSMRNGIAYQRQPAAPTTRGIDCLFWPTPKARDWKRSGGNRHSPDLPTMVRRRTPTATDGNGGSQDPKKRKAGHHTIRLRDRVGGPLNPEWVEWLMGWPIGWTDLQQLAMGKFQLWLQTHSDY